MKYAYNYSHQIIENKEQDFLEVYSPLSGKIFGYVVDSSKSEVKKIIKNASDAQKSWSQLTFKKRCEVFYRYRELLFIHKEEIANLIIEENGKTYEEAEAEVFKAIELVEFSLSLPSIISGDVQIVSNGIEVKEIKEPIGVIASIVPFNFPMMVPHWTLSNALVLGNSLIMKASEKTPFTLLKVAELLEQSGLPKGLFNIVNGSVNAVEELCENPLISGVTFVGSSKVAKIVYRNSTQNLKRCLALGEAKNFIVVTKEVDPESTAKEIIASAFGMSGQRCMAASVLVGIGNIDHIIDEIIKNVTKLNPVISNDAVNNIKNYIKVCKENGSEILLDGSKEIFNTENKDFLINSTIIKHHDISQLFSFEVFGPVLEILCVDTIEEAINLQNSSPYGNGASVFTTSGKIANELSLRLNAGMVGVNIGVPVPRDPFGFGGIKDSKYGYGDITGKNSINFYINIKKITTKWNYRDKIDWMS